jgi:hypothetical protein
MDTDVYSYLRTHATELGSRILETYPPLQSTKDLVALPIATLLRKALTAMLDRLLHHGHVLKCGPRSWRTKTGTPGEGQ